MSITELSRGQLVELKQRYIDLHLMETESRNASYEELLNADTIVPDEAIFENYNSFEFVEDDFFTGDFL